MNVTTERLHEFAVRYTAAWSSGVPQRVANCYAEDGWLKVNSAMPAVGRSAISEVARGFMSAFPDLELTMDGVGVAGALAIYRWTFAGTNTGPGGSGNRVRFSGYEEWKIGEHGLIAESLGHFDEAEYQWQLKNGIG